MTKQSRSEYTRLQLVRAAAELFDRNGFAGVTLDDVSRVAGVTKGAFYYHFASKKELAGAIQAEACAMLRSFVDRQTATERPALQSLIDITHVLARWLDREPVVRASLRIARECGGRGPQFVDFYLELLATVDATLLRAQRAGDLEEGVMTDVVSTLMLTVWVGIEVLWRAGIRRGSMRAELGDIWNLALPGIVSANRLSEFNTAGQGSARTPIGIRNRDPGGR